MARSARQYQDRRWLRRAAPYLLIIGLGAALSTYRSTTLTAWSDEQGTLGLCSQPLRKVWPMILACGGYFHQEIASMAPGYYLLIKGLFDLFGVHLIVARLASAAGQITAAAMTYRILDRAGRHTSAGIAAGLMLIEPALLWHAGDARPYSVLLGIQAVSIWLLLSPDFEKRVWIWLIVAAITPYFHHYALLLLGIEALYVWIYRPRARRYLLFLVPVVAPCVVLLQRAMAAAAAGHGSWAPMQFWSMVGGTLARLGGIYPVDVGSYPFSVMIPLAVGIGMVLFSLGVALVNRTPAHLWLGGTTCMYVLLIPLLHWWKNVNHDPRYFIVGLGLALVWFVICLGQLRRGRLLVPVSAIVGCYLLIIDTSLPRLGATSPFRIAEPDEIRKVISLPGPIVFYPPSAFGPFLCANPSDSKDRFLVSVDDAVPSELQTFLSWVAVPFNRATSWDEFRGRYLGHRAFTVVLNRWEMLRSGGSWFCSGYDPSQASGDYGINMLWADHPYLVGLRYVPRGGSSTSRAVR